MDQMTIDIVQESFDKVAPIAETAAELFYADLFETAPEVKPYFANADMAEQGKKLMTTLGLVVKGLNDLDKIIPVAQALAVRHIDYGVKAEDYAKVGASLIRTLEKGLGDEFTAATKDSWVEAYTALSGAMIAAAYDDEAAS